MAEPLRSARRTILRFDVDRPNAVEQQAIWQQSLGSFAPVLNGQVERLVAQFSLSMEGIRAASTRVPVA